MKALSALTGGAGIVSGPHTFHHFRGEGDVDIFLLGEEHSNQGVCPFKGIDVVDLVMTCLDEGMQVYLEMPCYYESKPDPLVECPALPRSGVRADVLNDLRACAQEYIRNTPLAHRGSTGAAVQFTDNREEAGPLPFSLEEQKFVMDVEARARGGDEDGARWAVTDRFLQPLRTASTGSTARCSEFVKAIEGGGCGHVDRYVEEQWGSRVTAKARAMPEVLRRRFPDFISDAVLTYRQAMDDAMNLYTLWLIARGRAGGAGAAPPRALFYGGSAHTLALAENLQALSFVLVNSRVQETSNSCMRLKRGAASGTP
ncbi:hypothetical protein JKP88DRAFT_273042 [Tribonema minus]|uniref:Uncharacterized protein n=1 Tax=Tribonema minus TaxID=303371 RepID=A0A836CGM7_9STRA|nr:hypothetical protein JKP88DRAFT_273042 [Tribonema minus]